MEGPRDIDYKGIGEGLSTAFPRDSSPSEPTISLSDGWYGLSPHQESLPVPYSNTWTANLALGSELESKSCEGVSVSSIQGASLPPPTNEDPSQPSLTPLERYCCDVQTYEQLVVGKVGALRSLARLAELDNSLDVTTKLLGGFTSQMSASSWSILSSSGGETNMIPALELDKLIRMRDSPEWKAVPQDEQAKHLRKITKLRRRVKAEGSPRKMKSVRVRKRGKSSNGSNETPGI
ncbi:hypothetical protein F4859DRAFT_75992 [Xylaria cf. heliscus]|nr:hypothetical protein F4859DRAFT_75992 [Xylaria cf. heliscus]